MSVFCSVTVSTGKAADRGVGERAPGSQPQTDFWGRETDWKRTTQILGSLDSLCSQVGELVWILNLMLGRKPNIRISSLRGEKIGVTKGTSNKGHFQAWCSLILRYQHTEACCHIKAIPWNLGSLRHPRGKTSCQPIWNSGGNCECLDRSSLWILVLSFKELVACWLLGVGSCWFSFHVTFRAHGEVKAPHWSICLLGSQKRWSFCQMSGWGVATWMSWVVWPYCIGTGRLTHCHLQPALHLAFIKCTADDVSLPPGSLSFPPWKKTSGQTVVTIKASRPKLCLSEVVKINLPKYLQMQIKPSVD